MWGEIEKVIFPDEKTLKLAKKDIEDGVVGTFHELAEKHGGRIIYSQDLYEVSDGS